MRPETQQLETLARQVLPHLEGWTLAPPKAADLWWVALVNADGAELHWSHSNRTGQKGRLRIGVSYPSVRGQSYGPWRQEDWPEITVSLTRPPAQIAGEITRRVLPTYLEQFAEARRKAREAEAAERKARALARRLAVLLQTRPPDEGRTGSVDELRVYLPNGSAADGMFTLTLHGSVSLKLTNLAPDVAEDLAARLAEWFTSKSPAVPPPPAEADEVETRRPTCPGCGEDLYLDQVEGPMGAGGLRLRCAGCALPLALGERSTS